MHKAILIVAGALAVLSATVGPAGADMGRRCEPRALTASEKDAADKLATALRRALPAAPADWKIRDEKWNAASGSCDTNGRMVPRPVSLHVLRSYEPKERKSAPPVSATAPAAASTVKENPRLSVLEADIKALQLKLRESDAAYRAARVSGDSAAQKQASARSRESRDALRPLQKELTELRREQHRQRAAASAERTQAAKAQAAAARANRQEASVVIYVNRRQLDFRTAPERISASGVPLAVKDADNTYLLFGAWDKPSPRGWMATIDESAATDKVQTIAVRIDGSPAMTEPLLKTLDIGTIKATLAR